MNRRKNLICFLVSFVVSYVFYIMTTAPDVTFTDNGELAAVCSTLGIAHPTGYPLFAILGYLWSLLPLPFSEVYSLNLFAGFLTAASVGVFYLLVESLLKIKPRNETKSKKRKGAKGKKNDSSLSEKLGEDGVKLIALASAFFYAFAGIIWAQATSLEVYSLHLLLMNLTLLLVVKGVSSEKKKEAYFFVAALVLGMSFSNHMTSILLIPPILFMYFKRPGEKFDFGEGRFKILLVLLIPFFVGLSFYLYLPLRSAAMPEFNWGWVSRSFDKFLYHVSGKQYQVWMFSDPSTWQTNIQKFIEILPRQLAWIGFIPAVVGIYASYKAAKEIFWFLALLVLCCVLYSMNYSITDIESYFITAVAGLIVFAAFGVAYLIRTKPKLVPLAFVLPVLALAFNYTSNDRSDGYVVPEYTRILLKKIEPNAVIISAQWDFFCSAFWYKQRVEGVRPDITLIEQELLRRTWYLEQLKRWYPETITPCEAEINAYLKDLELFESGEDYQAGVLQGKYENLLNCFIDKNIGEKPVYITLDIMQKENNVGRKYEKIADGFALKLVENRKGISVTTDDINIEKFLKSLNDSEGLFVEATRNNAAINFVNVARYQFTTGDVEGAKNTMQKAYKIAPENEYVLNTMRNMTNANIRN